MYVKHKQPAPHQRAQKIHLLWARFLERRVVYVTTGCYILIKKKIKQNKTKQKTKTDAWCAIHKTNID